MFEFYATCIIFRSVCQSASYSVGHSVVKVEQKLSSMEKVTKDLLTQQNIPVHVQNLLELVGVCCLSDLLEINEDFIKNVEDQIKGGKVINLIDLSLKSNRMKYFGLDLYDVKSFEFRILDKMKLLKISAAAEVKLNQKKSNNP